MSQEEEEVKRYILACEALSNSTDKDVIHEAGEFVNDFRKTSAAWRISNLLLETPNLPVSVYFHAANALRTKIVYDLKEITDLEDRENLRDRLIQHLVRMCDPSAAGLGQNVRTQLAVAVAAFAIKTYQEFPGGNALRYLMEVLMGNDHLLAFLEVLIVIPAESVDGRMRLNREQIEGATKSFAASGSDVLEILEQFMRATGDDRNLQKKVLTCFSEWVSFEVIPASVIAETFMFQATFEAFEVNELFDACIDAVRSMIRCSRNIRASLPMVEVIFPRVLALREVYGMCIIFIFIYIYCLFSFPLIHFYFSFRFFLFCMVCVCMCESTTKVGKRVMF